MRIGMYGLGTMGYNLSLNLHDHGHDVVGYDEREEYCGRYEDAGLDVAETPDDFVMALDEPRVVWLMLRDGEPTDAAIRACLPLLGEGDVLIDGGNSHFDDSRRRAEQCAARGVRFLDVGVSGGMAGALEGACLMVGGTDEAFEAVRPALADICCAGGLLHAGPSGAGHFAKMVHNAIEYGMMESIGEGMALLRGSDYDFDLAAVAGLWCHGSILRSWLMELVASGLGEDPELSDVTGIVGASGEAKWAVQAAVDEEVPVPVIAQALFERTGSLLGDDDFSKKVVASLRHGFAGHPYSSR